MVEGDVGRPVPPQGQEVQDKVGSGPMSSGGGPHEGVLVLEAADRKLELLDLQ